MYKVRFECRNRYLNNLKDFLKYQSTIQQILNSIIILLIVSLSFLTIISAKYEIIPTEARTENFVDNTNNLEISLTAPETWNSGTLSVTIPKLDWKVHSLIAASDDVSTFFVVMNLPSLVNLVLPLGQGPGMLSEFLKNYVSLKSEFEVTLSNGSSEHAYLIGVTPKQIEEISSLHSSLNRSVDAVLIFKEYLGSSYLIAYGTSSGKLEQYQHQFQSILNSIIFKLIS